MPYDYAGSNLADAQERATASTAQAAQAFGRLISFAESDDTGQTRVVAAFLATVVGRHHFDIYDLRRLDAVIGDDILACIDAIRWARFALTDLVPASLERCEQVCRDFGHR